MDTPRKLYFKGTEKIMNENGYDLTSAISSFKEVSHAEFFNHL